MTRIEVRNLLKTRNSAFRFCGICPLTSFAQLFNYEIFHLPPPKLGQKFYCSSFLIASLFTFLFFQYIMIFPLTL